MCSKHFTKDCFDTSSRLREEFGLTTPGKKPRGKLVPDAVPTIFDELAEEATSSDSSSVKDGPSKDQHAPRPSMQSSEVEVPTTRSMSTQTAVPTSTKFTQVAAPMLKKATQTPVQCVVQRDKRYDLDFKCAFCGSMFAFVEYLKEHHIIAHLSKKGTHPCRFCNDYRSYDTSDVEKHETVHTMEMPFVCQVCMTGYTRRSSMDKHLRAVHEGVGAGQCPICGCTFREKLHLQLHKMSYNHGPFICKRCGIAYKRSGSLSKHTCVVATT